MSGGFYKVTITDQDYDSTTYITYVSASSKNAAIVQAAALAGGEKMRREHKRMGREPHASDAQMTEPAVKLETVHFDDEFERRQDLVTVMVMGKEVP